MLGIFPVLILVIASFVQCYSTDNNFRSSYLTIWDDKVLLGHVITVHYVDGITLCAHDCLSKPGCRSFNFGKDSNLCELNNSSSKPKDLVSKESFLHGSLIIVPIIKFVFTTLGAQGPTGPTNTSGYLGTTLEGHVRLKSGTQEWTVPHTGTYYIEAFGASGANGTCDNSCSGWRLGGLGAKITGSFKLKRGQQLKILVGQKGQVGRKDSSSPGGGGGGTFVTFMDNSPLVVAGGGGGAPVSNDGDPGQAGREGSRHGGKAGSGGRLSNPDLMAGTGAGIWGDGEGKDGMAMSFRKGGISANVDFSKGGFGGGGYGHLLPGGGGGYSGGGVEGNHPSSGTAGGGGSINNGTSQTNESGVNEGDGKVIITLIN